MCTQSRDLIQNWIRTNFPLFLPSDPGDQGDTAPAVARRDEALRDSVNTGSPANRRFVHNYLERMVDKEFAIVDAAPKDHQDSRSGTATGATRKGTTTPDADKDSGEPVEKDSATVRDDDRAVPQGGSTTATTPPKLEQESATASARSHTSADVRASTAAAAALQTTDVSSGTRDTVSRNAVDLANATIRIKKCAEAIVELSGDDEMLLQQRLGDDLFKLLDDRLDRSLLEMLTTAQMLPNKRQRV